MLHWSAVYGRAIYFLLHPSLMRFFLKKKKDRLHKHKSEICKIYGRKKYKGKEKRKSSLLLFCLLWAASQTHTKLQE